MKITNAKDISKDTSTYLLYANPGTGKTTTLKFLPGRTLVAAIDKTAHVLQGQENIDILEFDTHNAWSEWEAFVKWLSEGGLEPYDNLAIDNVSELIRAMLAEKGRKGKNNRVPEMAHYQQMDFFLLDSIRYLKTLNKRLVLTAWESTDEWRTQEGQIFNRAYPDVREKILPNLMGICDVVARLVYNPETEKRGYLLQPSNQVFSKNQLDDRKFCLQEDLFKVGFVPTTADTE